ncbi:2680_t:CDS:2 [Entrophospora sp. SA101]|nr:2680_t:CDS:2 [Entrophospora sp. SA101]
MPYTTEEIYNKFKELGGSHNLREDCGTLARGFEKFESLNGEKITEELTKTLSKQDFDFKKSILLQKINEISSGLQARTECRRELDTLRSQLGQETYQ